MEKYHHVANYWAAFVLWAKTPLSFPQDSFALVDFVLHADPDEFEANANALLSSEQKFTLPVRRPSPSSKRV
ncbi:MAG: hypothetical protein HT580_14455 [Dechloromonas sp.]|nr:MAG: hypothetical protein HT580_14455 [Dechloromonas sp.]